MAGETSQGKSLEALLSGRLSDGGIACDRRGFLRGAAVLAGAAGFGILPAKPVQAGEGRGHGLSFFGDLKYPAGFARFDYVNPDAPKGGEVATQVASWAYNQNPSTFNTLNSYVLQGDGAYGMSLTFASLMGGTLDTIDNLYGFVAEEVEVSGDGRTYRFFLNKAATFHDGSPLTAADVIFSIETLKTDGHPSIALQLQHVEEAVAEDDRTLRIVYAEGTPGSIPLTVAGGVPIFSAAWWKGRDFKATLSEPPLGSGPYKVKDFTFGRTIRFERVKDYWAVNHPTMIGSTNFDIVRYEFFRDRNTAFEALKKGTTTFREDHSSKSWATAYDFPAFKNGEVVRDIVPDGSPSGAQGWFMNMRRPKFQNPLVRQALAMAFDFEWANANLMYDTYKRTTSFFENSDMKATGEPSPEELALLEPLKAEIPPEAFGPAILPPVTDGSGRDRKVLRAVQDLLKKAGCTREGDRWLLPGGEPLTFEILDDDNVFEPIVGSYFSTLKLIGIPANFRLVDAAQANARVRDFEFDMTPFRSSMPVYPDNYFKLIFGSEAADQQGSRNLAGIRNKGVDSLIGTIIAAKTRPDFVNACRALDRVLRAIYPWVPHWYSGTHKLAYWDVYEHPETLPPYGVGLLDIWWLNKDKAQKLGKGI
ncbi:Oligopeptide-binding protein AppA precursor [Hartmannibacter diazotrophicus]|uniref:Oligopeptide-binding protein AppA n=1 Tax=Hartmannibacter diazotrophicus TaxID=1482074 RepID=A0A2C9D1J8_9HYPH|nr:extracellular solute-binding protein [Hartmannibacter diazotrophicus]SON53681.1 Oligopeptide-binding protein AppA precursor [Hartmannibacter diazotrophicus]